MRRMFPLFAVMLLAMSMLAVPAVAIHTNGPLVQAQSFPGNFVASDDTQVCYGLENLDVDIGTGDVIGFKIDPPASFSDAYVSFVLSTDGKSLSWSSTGATVHAVIVKGGPNFNLYDYSGTGADHDNGLVSPLHKGKTPGISHYNVCYTPDEPPTGAQGCTPGYWRNHADRWAGAAPADDFDLTFDVDAFDPDITLGQAIWLGGGGVNALARHGTAALLNSYGGVANTGDGATVNYPYTTAQVIAMVQASIADGTFDHSTLAAANELGCPLSGTRANPAS